MNMKFSHFAEPITVNKPTDELYLEISYIFSYYIVDEHLKVLQSLNNTHICRIKGCGGAGWPPTNNFRKT